MAHISTSDLKEVLSRPIVWVAALGYFVDIFDLILFGMLRVDSLQGLGITASEDLESYGLLLDNWQMAGMLIGGILWGKLGDKKGRLSVLFGSIITYSLANIANGLVQDVHSYAFWRFVAGLGLAGELGAGITMVSEVLSSRLRGVGTAFVATVGLLGAVVGGSLVTLLKGIHVEGIDPWRLTYFIGGAMGLVLLILRIGVRESYVFEKTKKEKVSRGNFSTIVRNPKSLRKYLGVIFIALPVWYAVQFYAKYSLELSEAMNISLPPGTSVVVTSISLIYLGLTIGDALSGYISQRLESRKRTLRLFLGITIFGIVLFWMVARVSMFWFYTSVFVIGLGTGYWAVFMSVAAESFGTNVRSSVTNTAPNFVRGSVILMNLSYIALQSVASLGRIGANLVLGVVIFSLAFWGWRQLDETFHKDLDYLEE